MASAMILIFFSLVALGFLIPSDQVAATKSSSGRDEAISNAIALVTDGDRNSKGNNIRVHKSMRFDVYGDDYESLIRDIRAELNHSVSNGIPVLMPQQDHETAASTEWLDILLVADDSLITVRLEQSNLYVRGYSVGTDLFFWEFTDSHLINRSRDLLFSGSYSGSHGLESTAAVSRYRLPLGGPQLANAVHTLARLNPPIGGDNAREAARSLLVVVQMIAEAARFRTISDHIGYNYWNDLRLDSRMIEMQNGWGRLSTAVRQLGEDPTPDTDLPNIPADNPTQVSNYGQALLALGMLLITRPKGGGSRSADYGRCLMNLEYVRVNNIDGENPGDLFGTVRVDDGWYTYTFYDRIADARQSVGPGGFATLTDPSHPYAVSGADASLIRVDLFDYDIVPPNDRIAQGEIVWDPMIESVNFDNYDKHLQQVVFGDYGDVTVGYSVLINALSVTIEVQLLDGDGEDPADVYGTLTASQVLGGSAGLTPITLFDKSSGEFVVVGKFRPIPLTRKVIAASTTSMLTITADLWDYDSLSQPEAIAQDSVDFAVRPGRQSEVIHGQYGRVDVIITCE